MRYAAAFGMGILTHGLLDLLPHCYPIPSKADALLSLVLLMFAVLRSSKTFRPLLITAFAGAVFPDVLDLSPAILAKQTGWSIPLFPHFFPWHWKEYSGSVYKGSCAFSNGIHLLFLSIAGIVFRKKKDALLRLFR